MLSCTALKQYDPSNYETMNWKLGSGTHGKVKLLWLKETKQYAVGKFFSTVGNQEVVEKRLSDAEKEAQILARFEHPNIVQAFGITTLENQFGIILELVPYGDLERLLTVKTDISIPWKIRARFFVDPGDGLNYLHNHDSRKSYIHGDLKPQNILLGDGLKIKLGDFGAAEIAKFTGATSLICGGKNAQHTAFYTAPEYLRDPSKRKHCAMDVYSYSIIGYEILTRKAVYSDKNVNCDIVIDLIKGGLRSINMTNLDKVEQSLKNKNNDFDIFLELKGIMQECWEIKPENRPKICDVKEQLEKRVLSKKIYDKESDKNAESIALNCELNLPCYEKRQTSIPGEILQKWTLVFGFTIMLFVAVLIQQITKYRVSRSGSAAISDVFLSLNGSLLEKYNSNLDSSVVWRIPSQYREKSFGNLQSIVKVKNYVYIISSRESTKILRINFSKSNPQSTLKELTWNYAYQRRKYIAFNDSLFAVGAYDNPMVLENRKSYVASLYNPDAEAWKTLRNTKYSHYGHALVSFRKLICTVGGKSRGDLVECFNSSSNNWSLLPPMKIGRFLAAAAEFNGELYVMGGVKLEKQAGKIDQGMPDVYMPIANVEKYNPDSNSWTEVASLVDARYDHCAAVFNGKIYVIGGLSGLVEVYDPAKNIWSDVKFIPNIQNHKKFIAIT